MRIRFIAVFLVALAMQGAIIDGIVATVGRSVITDSMVRRSIRVSAFLAGTPLSEPAAVWEENRNRLIEQTLVKEEIRLSRYPVAQPDEIKAALEQAKRQMGGPEPFQAALRQYRVTEAEVAANLGWQITFARFLSYRFRPAVQVTEAALREFYLKWKPPGVKPRLDEAHDILESEFIAAESARYLDVWLSEVRQQTRIETFNRREAQP